MNCRIIIIILIMCLSFKAFSQDWQRAGQLPVGHVRGLYVIGTDKKLYATGEESLFRSNNENVDLWQPIELPKPFTINYIHDYGSKLLVGTEKHGIWEYRPEEKNVDLAWRNITDKLFAKETLRGENLSVNAIAATGDRILANVYHEGNPSHGGSHSRIYVSLNGGDSWGRATEFKNPHNFIFSFTIDKTETRVIASTLLDGILIGDISPTGLTTDSTLILTSVSPFVAKKIISIGQEEFIGLPYDTTLAVLYRSIDNGSTWSQIPISDPYVKKTITDISWSTTDLQLYASTYDGIYRITRDNLIAGKAWESEYPRASYISNIRTSANKFATAATGVLRRLSTSSQYTKAENGLTINYVYATHANSNYVLAVTDNGLFKSTVDLATPKFEWKQEEQANKILVYPNDRFLETRRAAIASKGVGPTEEIIIATNNGIIQSKDAGTSWTKFVSLPFSKPVRVDRDDPTKVASVSYQENIQSLMFAGNDLYAVAYEMPLILKDAQGSWQELNAGLPALRGANSGIIRGMQEISGEVYIYWEDYRSRSGGHDVWDFPDLAESGIYKFAKDKWVLVRSLDQRAKIYGFVAQGDNLIFSALNLLNDGTYTYTYHNFNVKTTQLHELNKILSDFDGYIKQIYNKDGNLFITNTENEKIFVSANGGKIWNSFDAPSTVSCLTVSNNFVYAGITGSGMYYRNFYEFFPIKVDAEKTVPSVKAGKDYNVPNTSESSEIISIRLNQYIPGTKVTLYTRSLTEKNWEPYDKIDFDIDSSKFSTLLPHTQFDKVGLAYYWAVTPPPSYRNPADTTVETSVVQVAIEHQDGIVVPEKLNIKRDPKKTPYLMLSFPLVRDNNSVQEMLGQELNVEKGDDVWRLVTYNTKDNPWPPIRAEAQLNVGQGYWLAATKDKNNKRDPLQITTSSGRTVAHELKKDDDDNYYYEIPINANDWTQIGNPFLLDVNWDDIQKYPLNEALKEEQFFSYTNSNSERSKGGKLTPFSGGYISNTTPETTLRIPLKPTNKAGRISAEPELVEDAIMAVGFSIQSEEMTCHLPGLGIHAEAQAGLDKFDLVVPPSPGGFPTMRFRTAAEKQSVTRSVVPPQGQGQEWEFTISDIDEDSKATLNWQGLKMEEGKVLWLHDIDGERKIDMQSVNIYQFLGIRRFRVYYGTEQYLKEHVMPEKSLLAVYPNPMSEKAVIRFTLPKNNESSTVKLALLDARGSYIQEIHQSTFEAGFHELEWNTTGFVQKLPQGLYLVEMQITNSHGTKTYYQKVIKR